jgi:hypothetical protein
VRHRAGYRILAVIADQGRPAIPHLPPTANTSGFSPSFAPT